MENTKIQSLLDEMLILCEDICKGTDLTFNDLFSYLKVKNTIFQNEQHP